MKMGDFHPLGWPAGPSVTLWLIRIPSAPDPTPTLARIVRTRISRTGSILAPCQEERMNRCACGSTQIIAEAILIQRTSVYADGSERQEWVGDELCSVTCAVCSREVRLDAAMTISLMHHLIERRETTDGVMG
jgi:hypothetical protein